MSHYTGKIALVTGGARKDCGVTVGRDPHCDPENLRLDYDATTKLRKDGGA